MLQRAYWQALILCADMSEATYLISYQKARDEFIADAFLGNCKKAAKTFGNEPGKCGPPHL